MMPKPASGKWMEMIRSARSPISSISGEALKKPRRVEGNSWNTMRPQVMMLMAVATVSFTVLFTRSIRAAPKL